MTPIRDRRVALWSVAAVLALTLLPAAPAHAQDQAFKDGMKAVDAKKWADVMKFMRAAIDSGAPESQRTVEYGGVLGVRTKTTVYLPYFHLGQALFMMQPQDCAGAIDAWSASEKQGVVQAHPPFNAIIQSGYAVCEGRGILPPKTYAPVAARTQQQYADVNDLARSVSTLGQQHPEQWPPEMRDLHQTASDELDVARRRLATGARSRAEKDFADAAAAAERARVILVKLDANLRSAIETTSSAQRLARDAEQALAVADADDRQIDTRSSGRGAALAPSLAATRQQGREALGRGRALYNTGVKASNAAQLIEARAAAREAEARFRHVLDEMTRAEQVTLERQLADARNSAARALGLLDESVATLDRYMAANPVLAAPIAADYAAARTRGDAVRRRLESAAKSGSVTAIAQATQMTADVRARLSELTAKLGSITLRQRGVSQALEDSAAQLFAGRYQEVLQLLRPADGFADDPLQLHVHLFRAASLHALYLRSGETKQELRAQALAEIEECRKIQPTFRPDPRAFSPAFIALYQGAGAANGQAAPPLRQ